MNAVDSYLGLTWDHPRGRAALEAATQLGGSRAIQLRWETHSLEGFESAPLRELAGRYDLIVLDHPHLGDALASGCLRSMESVMGQTFVESVAARAVGPSLESYQMEGSTWALPLDAATQVSVRRADLVTTDPVSWDDVIGLSHDVPVALSLSGPHAYLSFASICQSLGKPLARGVSEQLVDPIVGDRALQIMSDLASRAPSNTEWQNPIELLERMAASQELAFIPLIYGYVGYASSALPRPLTFGSSPSGDGRQIGSTLGGTGIAITSRATVTNGLLDYLAWLLSDDVQCGFIPQHEGQPAMRAAWESEEVNARVGDFYRRTRPSIDGAWTRPRFAGFTAVQSAMSEAIREAVRLRHPTAETLDELTRLQNNGAAAAHHKEGARSAQRERNTSEVRTGA